MHDLILMKIGGSVCTDKSGGEPRIREKTVGRIGSEIAAAMKERDFRLLLSNGAGPFGHVNVTRYGIDDGLKTQKDWQGFAKTVCDCSYENCVISGILRKEGLLAMPFPSSSVIVQRDKRIISFPMEVLEKLWEQNDKVVPVMNGTMVPDTRLGGSVVSGDRPLEHLAERLGAGLVIFATDVDGIFTADPNRDKGAKLIDVITKESFRDIRHGISGSSNVDVTGGMLRKIEELVSLGIRTLVINGNAPGRVRDALLGLEVKGTVINP